MTIDELIEQAAGAREALGGDAQARIACRPGYPLRAALACVTVPPRTGPSGLASADETAAGQQNDGTFLWLAAGGLPGPENPMPRSGPGSAPASPQRWNGDEQHRQVPRWTSRPRSPAPAARAAARPGWIAVLAGDWTRLWCTACFLAMPAS
jgi:hypothetical protein